MSAAAVAPAAPRSAPVAGAAPPLRVCLVCSEYPPGLHGGIGTCMQVVGRALAGAGHAVRAVGVYADLARPVEEDDRGVRVLRLPIPAGRMGWVAARLALWRQVAAWCRAGEIDVVEVPDYEGWAAGWPRLPVPVVARANGGIGFFAAELGRRATWSGWLLERASLRRADSWAAASRYAGEVTARVFRPARALDAVLYNPVEIVAAGTAAARSRHRIVFTGTLTEKKGVVSLIDAWPAVAARHPEAELHVYGKDGAAPDGGSMQAHLERRLPTGARVRFHGHAPRETLFQALQSARAAIFPSRSEAFGIAPIEAMSAGCPTIFSRCGPGPELIRDDVDGLLVDPYAPAAIAAALDRLLGDDALAARLGPAGRARAIGCFAIDALLPVNVAFYRAAIARFAPRRAGEPC